MSGHLSPTVGPTSSQNLAYQVVEELGTAIVSGFYGAQNPIPIQGNLHKQYGTSRSTLREAVKVLTAKGLLGARPRQGTWVEPEENWNWLDADVLRWSRGAELSWPLLRELAQFRLAVEPKAAAIAAETATRERKEAIERTLARLAAAEVGDDDPVQAEIAFHIAIMRASENRFFAQVGRVPESAIRFSIRLNNRLKRVRSVNFSDHQRIYDAIVARRARKAELALRAMIQETLNLIEQAAAKHQFAQHETKASRVVTSQSVVTHEADSALTRHCSRKAVNR